MISWKKIRLVVLDYWHRVLAGLAALGGVILLMYFSQVQINERWRRLEDVRVDPVQIGRSDSSQEVEEVDQPLGDMLPPPVHFEFPRSDGLSAVEYWGPPIRERGLRVPRIPLQSPPSLSGPPSP